MPASPARDRGSLVLCTTVLVALAIPYCLHLGGSALWDPDEAISAEIAREMLESGNGLSPSFNFQPLPPGPPLTHWAVLASYRLSGVREFSVRVPGVLAAVGTLLFVFGTARRLFSPAAGLLAAAICATTPRFLVLTRTLPVDALLLLCLTGTAYLVVRGTVDKSRTSWRAAYGLAALGFLTAGPIAIVIPVGACLLWALWSRRFKTADAQPLPGGAIFLAVVLPFCAAVGWMHGWAGLGSLLQLEHPMRHASGLSEPGWGPLYYFPIYLADFFPWSLLSLTALVFLWYAKKIRLSADGLLFPLIWGALVFVLFSLAPGKQENRIAPVYPMAAVFLAGVLETARRDSEGPALAPSEDGPRRLSMARLWSWAVGLAALMLLTISLVALFALRAIVPDLPRVIHYSAPAVLLVAALAISMSVARLRLHRCILILAASLWVVFLLVPLVYLPAAEPFRPVRDLCAAIGARMVPGDEAGYYRASVPSMVYYLRRPIYEEFNADAMVGRFRSPRRVFCIMTEQDENYFVGSRDQILYILDRRPRLVTRLRGLFDQSNWAQQELVLVSNRPPGEPATSGGRGVQ